MKKITKILTALSVLSACLMISGCNLIFEGMFGGGNNNSSDDGDYYDQDKNYYPGNEAVFYVSNSDSTMVYKTFTLMASGTYCNVWYINNDFGYMNSVSVSNSVFKSLASKFDSLYKKEVNIFGTNKFSGCVKAGCISHSPDKVNIIVYDINGDSSYSQTSGVFGYFYSGDLFKRTPQSGSNETELFNIDSHFLKLNPNGMYSTLAHEFQHMLRFVQKYMIKNLTHEDDTWFNEMCSLVCEDILFSELEIKSEEGPHARLSVFNDYYSLGFREWRKTNYYVTDDYSGRKIGDVFASYANVYAFGAFLLRNCGGVALYNKIATNNYYKPELCLYHALKDVGYEVESGETEQEAAENTISVLLEEFFQVLINTDGNDSYPTLNKGFTDEFNGIKYNISALDLKDVPGHYRSKPAIGTSPNTLKLPVGAYGFAINKVSSDFDLSDFKKSSPYVRPLKYIFGGKNYLIRMNDSKYEVSSSQAGTLESYSMSMDTVPEVSDSDRSVKSGYVSPARYIRIDYEEDPEEIRRRIKAFEGN